MIKFKINTSIVTLAMILSTPVQALDILGRTRNEGGQGVKRGLVALYQFSPTRNNVALPANTIADESGVGAPLDLKISNTTAIQRKCDRSFYDPVTKSQQTVCYLDFNEGSKNGVKSIVEAAKITNQCKATNNMTVEMWVRNDRADELTKEGRMMPLKIVTLGRNTEQMVNGRYLGSSNDSNFYVGLDYDMAPQYTASVRRGNRTQRNAQANDGFTSASASYNNQQAALYSIETSHTSLNTPDTSDSKILANNKLQQVIFTYKANGTATLYTS